MFRRLSFMSVCCYYFFYSNVHHTEMQNNRYQNYASSVPKSSRNFRKKNSELQLRKIYVEYLNLSKLNIMNKGLKFLSKFASENNLDRIRRSTINKQILYVIVTFSEKVSSLFTENIN